MIAARSLLIAALVCAHSGTHTSAQSVTGAPKSNTLNAAQAVARIQTALHVTLRPDTVDTIKAGDAATPVTGIVTTFTPTMEVLRRAVASGANLIVTHEPSFYNHLDERTLFEHDPVLLEKLEYIRQHHLVLFRLHDGWHDREPDGIVEGFVKQMQWAQFRRLGELPLFLVPSTSLVEMARLVEQRTGARVVRVVGDPSLTVTQVAFAPGAGGEAGQVSALQRDDVQVLIAGEAREWETVEYTRDAMQQGRQKALILLGHDRSEEAGMEECARWLRTLFPAQNVFFVPAGEPYWTPDQPRKVPVNARR